MIQIQKLVLLSISMSLWAITSFGQMANLSVLTYNIAGLPDFISKSHPKKYNKQISPLVNGFDIVLVQEDFMYHRDFISKVTHSFRSTPDCEFYAYGKLPTHENKLHCLVSLGDGLNRLSSSKFHNFKRVSWDKCNGVFDSGSDCLTPKGFSFAIHEIAPNKFIHVYNHHAEAGSNSKDKKTRENNLKQLARAINNLSPNAAVIVAGDTNCRYTREEKVLNNFLQDTNLTDVWVRLGKESAESIDKIFYRSSKNIRITPVKHTIESHRFTTNDGKSLSDHLAVSADLIIHF